MKELKLNWKRLPEDQKKALKAEAAYEAKGKMKIGDRPVGYRAMIVFKKREGAKRKAWYIQFSIDTDIFEMPSQDSYGQAKAAILKAMTAKLEGLAQESEGRANLIAFIEAIYEKHGQKIQGKPLKAYTTRELEQHLMNLKAGKYPWKIPAPALPEGPAPEEWPPEKRREVMKAAFQLLAEAFDRGAGAMRAFAAAMEKEGGHGEA